MTKERLALRVPRQRLPGPLARQLHRTFTVPRLRRAVTAAMTTTLSTGMQAFVIEGGRPLSGTIRAAGNKNGALPILAACVLATEPVHLSNVPRIRDVQTMLELLADIGAELEWTGENDVTVDTTGIHKTDLDEELCRRIRASFLLTGPLLARSAAHRAAAGRRRDRPAPARPAHPRARRARSRGRDQRALRDAHAGLPGQGDLPRRGERDGHGERGHGGGAGRGRDGDRERRLRAARAGPLPLPRLARRPDRRNRVERAPGARRARSCAAAAGGSRPSTSRSAASSGSRPRPAAI